ncbi:MAG TPA: class I SAM-dependent methyltransferase [Noviherbaspirillum sp.]
MNENLRRYREHGFNEVEGWCAEQLFVAISTLNDAPINKRGGCLEIGIHHGRFYILLNQVIAPQEKSYALDIFEAQHLNIDGSGAGSLHTFKSNLEKYDVHEGRNTHIIIGDSTDPGLKLEEVIGVASMRFISIDGGHTVEHTLSDLKLAERLVRNEGVVILDDILNYYWPGVVEGAGRYLSTYPTLVPFAIGHNKLYLCKLSYQNFYMQLFSRTPLASKTVRFYGHTIVVV